MDIEFDLPWDHIVSKNRKYTVTRGGRVILTAQYRDAKEALNLIGMSQYKDDPIEGDVKIRFDVFVPDNRRRDVFNVTQIIMDALEGIAYNDDKQIKDGRVINVGLDKDNPRVEVTVTEL